VLRIAPPPAKARPSVRLDDDLVHRREIDHEAAIADRITRPTVPAAPHGHKQIALTRKCDGMPNVFGRAALGDQRRPLVVHPVPDCARLVVVGMV
jgi:hypothetical protein